MTVPRPVDCGRPVDVDRLAVEYVLPLRWTEDAGLAALTGYLTWLGERVDVTVVDGSPPPIFQRHRAAWGDAVRHLPPDPTLRFANGKVNGVLTGVGAARHEHVIIADDDVRYDDPGLRAVAALLRHADLVRPQNYFDPLPWHARWDTARTLINRGFGVDYPGTFGLRRSTLVAAGGYDGDVLFENLELIRTVRAAGGVLRSPLDLYVRRLPPDAARFWQQRVRQAYDDLAQPVKLVAILPLLPGLVLAARRRRPRPVLAGALVAVAVAEVGRRRAAGRHVFPATASALAPVWLLERAACGWIAVGMRVFLGGARYAGGRLRVAAHSPRDLAARLAGRG